MDTDLFSEYPNISEAILPVTQMLQQFFRLECNRTEDEHFELEGRLGRFLPNGHFDADIGETMFFTVLQLLESFQRWSRIEDWTECNDVFYEATIAPSNPESQPTTCVVRSTVSVEQDKSIDIKHVVKHKLDHITLNSFPIDTSSCNLETSQCHMRHEIHARIACSCEKQIPASSLPLMVQPSHIRIKQRKRFILHSVGASVETFSFDATIVYTGQTKLEAEKAQAARRDAKYEIEVECLNPSLYLQSCDQNLSYLAVSLLLKLHDFIQAVNAPQIISFTVAEQPSQRRE